jgi:hypothetical protein
MATRKTALYLTGGTLFVAWLAAANMPSQDSPQPTDSARPAETVSATTLADEVHAQARRLQSRMAQAPVPENSSRNPFSFAARHRAERASQPIAAAVVEEPAPVPIAPPPMLTLMGIAEESVIGGIRRTAVIALRDPQGHPDPGGAADGDTILMVNEGQPVGSRYTVTKIGADAVELEDMVTKAYRRIALR